MNYPDEWTQEEYLINKKKLERMGVKVVLVDTILTPIEKVHTVIYNPYELSKNPKGSVFVFYCYSGSGTFKRLKEYKKKVSGLSLHITQRRQRILAKKHDGS